MKNDVRDRVLNISKKQRELLLEFEDLIRSENFDLEILTHYPFPHFNHGHVFIERKCWAADNEDQFHELLIAKGDRAKGLDKIESFLKDIKFLILIDPYIFNKGWRENDEDKIINEFHDRVLNNGDKLKKVHFIYGRGKVTKKIKNAILDKLKEKGIETSLSECDDLHDRLWIGDESKGLIVGHSFNGLGNKLSLITDIPEEDLKEVLRYIQKNELY